MLDSTKFGSPGVFRVAPIEDFDHIIIDQKCSREQRELLENSRAQIHVVDVDGTETTPWEEEN